MPVRVLFEYLAAGAPLSEFLEAFPSVSAQQVDTVLRAAERLLMDAITNQARADGRVLELAAQAAVLGRVRGAFSSRDGVVRSAQ